MELVCYLKMLSLAQTIQHQMVGQLMNKGKVIPLHAMEAHGVRGGIAPTHS
jgi:hypothetical protein